MLKKFLVFLAVTLISIIVGALYGVLHNQITYTISTEFFTHVMFYQFGLYDYFDDSPRLGAAIVGIFSTWWMGLGVGIVLGLVAFIYDDAKTMFFQTLKAMSITIFVTILTPFIIVTFYVLKEAMSQIDYLQYATVQPENVPSHLTVQDSYSFYIVSLIHDLSYLGGFLGMAAGIIFLILNFKRRIQQFKDPTDFTAI